MRKEEAKTEAKALVVLMAFLRSVFSVAAVAGQNEEAANLMRANRLESVTPTVRRVLPETAEKFYVPKTMLSVTWTRFGDNPAVVSVLVDPDEGKAVNVWSNLEVENKGGEM
ncbi:MAG: hypothetical protein KAT65_00340 [Methanophagales archaeon]|nr:hypothetical protein [Methanophagales archaeon]